MKGASDTPARAACRACVHNQCLRIRMANIQDLINSTIVIVCFISRKHENGHFCAFDVESWLPKHGKGLIRAFDIMGEEVTGYAIRMKCFIDKI